MVVCRVLSWLCEEYCCGGVKSIVAVVCMVGSRVVQGWDVE